MFILYVRFGQKFRRKEKTKRSILSLKDKYDTLEMEMKKEVSKQEEDKKKV